MAGRDLHRRGSQAVHRGPNRAPTISSVTIAPAGPTTGQTLTATVVASDPDGDSLTYAYQWTKNGVDIAGATASTLNLATAGNGDRGDQIRVRATASDGLLFEQPRDVLPGDRRQLGPDRHGRAEPRGPDDQPDAHRDRHPGRRRRRPRHADLHLDGRRRHRQDDRRHRLDHRLAGPLGRRQRRPRPGRGRLGSRPPTGPPRAPPPPPRPPSPTRPRRWPRSRSARRPQRPPRCSMRWPGRRPTPTTTPSRSPSSGRGTASTSRSAGATLDLSLVGNGDKGDVVRIRITAETMDAPRMARR